MYTLCRSTSASISESFTSQWRKSSSNLRNFLLEPLCLMQRNASEQAAAARTPTSEGRRGGAVEGRRAELPGGHLGLVLNEDLERRARAHEVAVAIRVVDARGRRPELGLPQAGHRVGGGGARVWASPLVGEHDGGGVRRVLEQIVVARHHALLDLGDLGANRDESVAEAVELRLVLRLGGLDHDGARHRPRHGGRVEVVVGEPLGNVGLGHARTPLEFPQVEDELVCAEARLARVQHLVVAREPRGHVIGVEDGDRRRAPQAVGAHHRAVHPRDGQDGRRAPRRGRDGAESLGAAHRHHRVRRDERLEVRGHANRADARPAAAVRDAEGLVQVEVADVGAEVAGAAQADLRVHVGAVHVDLPAAGVDRVADLDDGLLEDAVGRRVRHHERRQLGRVLGRLGFEVGDVDVAVGVAADRHDAHPAHRRARGVGAVRRDGDEADVALRLALRSLVGTDGAEAGVLAGGARVGLQRHAREAGDLAEHRLERRDELGVPGGLVGGRKGVDAVDFLPCDRHHLCG
mmetsp:Transcript_33392/g.78103  ORF Transcript_33392/g.78103 Transcript_33392/m.78103 type:complete len:520 (-) Transcript_33392:742-2301(-)